MRGGGQGCLAMAIRESKGVRTRYREAICRHPRSNTPYCRSLKAPGVGGSVRVHGEARQWIELVRELRPNRATHLVGAGDVAGPRRRLVFIDIAPHVGKSLGKIETRNTGRG